MERHETELLLSRGELAGLELNNRIVMAPMTRNRAEADGTPTDLMETYYRQRAAAGLMITEMTVVSAKGKSYLNAPGLHERRHVEGWRRVTETVHAVGGKIAVQLAHGGRISHPSMLPAGVNPVAPSAIAAKGKAYTANGAEPLVTPEALTIVGIADVVEQFRRSAALAEEAGFDGIEIHAANGYLLDQFLRDGSNHRTDEYGGTAGKRARLVVEVAAAVAGEFGRDRVGVRLSPFNGYNDMSDSNPVEHFLEIAAQLKPLKLGFLHLVEPGPLTVEGGAPLAGLMKERFGGAVIVNGGYDAKTAEQALRRGVAEAVSFGTPFIANPDYPARVARGLELRRADPATIYRGGAAGYTDYAAA